MTRIEQVRRFVEEQCRGQSQRGEEVGVMAVDVSDALGIWVNDASSDLSQLFRDGVLQKTGKRPVRYFPVDSGATALEPTPQPETNEAHAPVGTQTAGEAFMNVIGASGSIKAQIQMAKAAVLYPPQGLHTLIIGESGVGKSLLAEEMWRFAVENKAFGQDNDPPLVSFNCAEYADNPQLLLSQLFGHVKGAYTGANEVKKGLVEEADGGVLFLDEIHRLPPTGQEILFTLLDRGQFRRLGDTLNRNAKLMLIGATNENPESSLLTTFLRRIPVVIRLPKLSERSLAERFSLINLFLLREANRIGQSIHCTGDVLRILATYECKANIGDLKNDIQLCCAKSFLSFRSGKGSAQNQCLVLDVTDLPTKITTSLDEVGVPVNIASQHIYQQGLTVYPGDNAASQIASTDDYELPIDLYGFIEKKIEDYGKLNISQGERARRAVSDLEIYFESAVKKMHSNSEMDEDAILNGIISIPAWKTSKFILSRASRALDRRYTKTIEAALALHLQQRAMYASPIHNPNLRYARLKYATEIAFLQTILPDIRKQLQSDMSEDEVSFLAIFLSKPVQEKPPERVGLIIVAHGNTTASSMADFANQLLSTHHVRAINAPILKSQRETFEQLCREVCQCDQGKGVLILSDMGSFTAIGEELQQKTGVRCRVVPNVSSVLVLEAAKMITTINEDVDSIADRLIQRYYQYLLSIFSGIAGGMIGGFEKEQTEQRPVIIALCTTGIGTAQMIRELVQEHVEDAEKYEILTMSALQDVETAVTDLGRRVKLIIGNVKQNIPDVPFMSVESVLTPEGWHRISRVLQTGMMETVGGQSMDNPQLLRAMELLENRMELLVPKMDRKKLMESLTEMMRRLKEEFGEGVMNVDAYVGLFMHVMYLLERTENGNNAPMPTEVPPETLATMRPKINTLRAIMNNAAAPFGLAIPDTEIVCMLLGFPEVFGIETEPENEA